MTRVFPAPRVSRPRHLLHALDGVPARAIISALLCFGIGACDRLKSTEARVEAAKAALALGQWEVASLDLQKLAKSDPERPEVRLLLAQLALAVGDAPAAELELQRARALGIDKNAADNLLLEIWLAAGSGDKVIEYLEARSDSISSLDRAVALGRAQLAEGRLEQAAPQFERALQIDPQSGAATLGKAQVRARGGDLQGALDVVNAALSRTPAAADLLLLKGSILGGRGDFAGSVDAYKRASDSMAPATVPTRRAMAFVGQTEGYLALSRLDEAEASLARLGRLGPDSVAYRFLQARVALARGDYRNGIASLQRLISADESYLPARLLLGSAHVSQGNLLQGESQLAYVVARAPENVEARMALAKVRMLMNQPGEALKVLVPALELGAVDPQLASVARSAALLSGQATLAIESMEKGLRANSRADALRLDLAETYLASNQPSKALETLRQPVSSELSRYYRLLMDSTRRSGGATAESALVDKLLSRDKPSPVELNIAALSMMRTGNVKRADMVIRRARSLYPDDVQTLVAASRIAEAQADFAGAERDLRRAAALAQSSDTVQITLADFLARQGKIGDAIAYMTSSSVDRPTPVMLLALAKLHLSANQPAIASADIERALIQVPSRHDLRNLAGKMLLEARQFDTALAQFKAATDAAPSQPEYWVNSARAQVAMGNASAARESLTRALDIRSDSIEASAMMAMLLMKEGKRESALSLAESLGSRRKWDADSRLLVGDVLVEMGRVDVALESYRKALATKPSSIALLKTFFAARRVGSSLPDGAMREWLAVNPGDIGVRAVLAEHLLSTGAAQEAARQLEVLNAARSDNPVTLNNLAWAYHLLGDSRALSIAERAYALAPGSPQIKDTLGWIMARSGQLPKGVKLLESAARDMEKSMQVQVHYASALLQAGRAEEARNVAKRAESLPGTATERAELRRLMDSMKVAK